MPRSHSTPRPTGLCQRQWSEHLQHHSAAVLLHYYTIEMHPGPWSVATISPALDDTV